MNIDRRLEQLCDRVTLVEGIGHPRRGELCVMSFVALLAGERHTDRPVSASPLIRNLAIPINDAMPRDVRQRLKPFAARIVGTNDGHDRARAELLRRAILGEILPQARHDWGPARVAQRCHPPLESLFTGALGFAGSFRLAPEARDALLLLQLERDVPQGYEPCIGSAVGELLGRCMQDAVTREQASWYWHEAISLLDRLCDVGAEAHGEAIPDNRIARAEERLGGTSPGNTWLTGLRRLLPLTKAEGAF